MDILFFALLVAFLVWIFPFILAFAAALFAITAAAMLFLWETLSGIFKAR